MGNQTTKAYHEETFDYYVRAFQKPPSSERTPQLIVRVVTTLLLLILLVTHVKSVRVFKWEQSVSGGVLVTYLLAALGLTLCTVTESCENRALQVFLCSTGVTFLWANAVAISSRWHFANAFTQAMADILFALGVPLRRQIYMKISLGFMTAMCFMADLIIEVVFATYVID